MQDTATTGVLAAIAAPFFMALGFIIWDVIWKQSCGSAFALNLFKCNLASIGFVIAGSVFGFTTSSGSSGSTSTTSDDAIANNDDFIVAAVDTDGGSSIPISVGYLLLSGFIGIVIGDIAWLEALRQLGASRVLVIDTVKPFVAALLGWVVLGEALRIVAFSGIALTMVGILVVELERERVVVVVEVEVDDDGDGEDDLNDDDVGGDGDYEMVVAGELREEEEREDQQEVAGKNFQEAKVVAIADNEEQDVIEQQQEETSHLQQQEQQKLERLYLEPTIWDGKLKGYILAIGNVILDTYGSLLTKQHGGRFSSWSINLIRFGSAGVIMIVISCVMRLYHQAGRKKTILSHPVVPWYMLPNMDMISWLKICMGVLFVTFICPALSNYALFQIALAMALTLTSITPIYALLLEWLIHGSVKKPTWRSLGGATLAVGGVVILGVLSS